MGETGFKWKIEIKDGFLSKKGSGKYLRISKVYLLRLIFSIDSLI